MSITKDNIFSDPKISTLRSLYTPWDDTLSSKPYDTVKVKLAKDPHLWEKIMERIQKSNLKKKPKRSRESNGKSITTASTSLAKFS